MRISSSSALAVLLLFPAASPAQECVLSLINQPAEDRVVTDFANELFEKRAAMGTNLLSAIDNFENTMQFASGFEAEPKVAEALLATAFKESSGYLVGLADKQVPGTKQVVAAIQAVQAETKRAVAAQASHDVGTWIRTQRTIVSNHMTGATEGALPTSVSIKDAILEDLCWIQQDGGDLEAAVEEIAAAQSELGPVPTEEVYRRALFEDWIRANFDTIGGEGKTPGTVHIAWEVDVEGSPNDHPGGPYPLVWDEEDWTAEVVLPSPYGQRIAGGFNELGINPVDVRVVKKVCFETDGIAGGTATYCGALQADGRDRFGPNTPWATQAFADSAWREGTTSFRD